MTIDKNDPRLTAFALGELPPREASELEAAIKKDPALSAELAAIRKVADKLKATLAEEPLPKTEPSRSPKSAQKPSRLRRRLALYGSGVAAVLVLVGLFLPAMQPARECARGLAGMKSADELPVAAAVEEAELSEGDILRYGPSKERTSGAKEAAGGRSERKYWGYHKSTPNDKTATREPFTGPATPAPAGGPAESPAKKTQTGRSMVGVGVNSEAGLVGSIPQTGNAASPPIGKPAGKRSDGLRMLVTPRTIVAEEEISGRSVVVGMSAPGTFSADLDRSRGESFRGRTGPHNTEAYDKITENEFKRVADHPLSTFSIDVDTASYSMIRRMLTEQGRMPPPGAVRLEEMINYFDYDYQPPTDGRPFATHIDAARCPWNEKHNLVRIGLKGRVIDKKERDPANLVFLLDVSGSMRQPNKLPLLKDAMRMLVENLNEKDRVAIVVYAGASGLVLPSTRCDNKQKILDALGRLQAGGSTNGGAGITLAYATAAANHIRGGVNRVILCTDGDFNIGTTNQSDLVTMIEKKAKEGVFLTVLGFGMGNYKDSTLEKLADKGNGNYGYVDTNGEARKLLVEGLSGTLVTIAKDVKIQVEFNPRHVRGYRLLGYENRMLRKEDFNDDTKDAGEIGAGHTVTALYEIIPADSDEEIGKPKVDELKYQKPAKETDADSQESQVSQEMLTVKLRYKEPDGEKSKLLLFPFKGEIADFDKAGSDMKFASAVAAFGMILRGSQFKGDADYDSVIRWAKSSLGEDEFGYREELLKLIRAAKSLDNK